MTRKDDKAVLRERLALATCTLLGAGAAQAGDGNWLIDSSVLYYGEQDRVTAVEPVVSATRELGEEETLNVKLVVDSLTGASHNGATVTNYPQTFSGPSAAGAGGPGQDDDDEVENEGEGGTGYTIPAGQVPLDDSFHDTRAALSLTWAKPINRLWRYTLGGNFSNEFDFTSLGASGTLSRDFNKRNTTLTMGLALEADSIRPVGNTPVPLTVMGSAASKSTSDTENRNVTDVLLGVTQVINRKTIMQFNYGLSAASGYMTDPYKIVSVIPPPASSPAGYFIFENRPDSRTKHALYWETKYMLDNGDLLNPSYRFTTDDWGISSHTVDLRYRWMLPESWYLEPHARWYTQNEADFYVESLSSAAAIPAEVSADYRLGALTDTTVGLKVGKRLADDGDISVRLESFNQSGDSAVADLSALVLEFGYSFRW